MRDQIYGLSTALCVAALALAACTPPEAPVEDEWAAAATELDSTYATFSRAYAGANVQLLMEEVYAEEGYYLPPGSPILRGQDQFRGQFSFLERYARDDGPGPDISFEVVDRDIDGDLAYDIGVYTLRSPNAPADAEPSRGKFVVIWKRIDGEWRIWADGFSSME